jgi:hypothetical protein
VKIADFFSLIATEPERVIVAEVSTPPPEVLERIRQPQQGGAFTTLADLKAMPGWKAENRTLRYRHILGEPAADAAIDAWIRQHDLPGLPDDLRDLLKHANGIHLWANGDGVSYVNVAPIGEWDFARRKMYGPDAAPGMVDDRFIAISRHPDGAAYVVLDTISGTYFLMDVAGPDTSTPLANNVSGLLDWLWKRRSIPKLKPAKD